MIRRVFYFFREEEEEPNPDTTGPEENLRQKSAKMNDKSQESKEPA
jgi:hypothetical protein